MANVNGPLGTLGKVTVHLLPRDPSVGKGEFTRVAGDGIDDFRDYTSFVTKVKLTQAVNEVDFVEITLIGLASGDESSPAYDPSNPTMSTKSPKKPSERKDDWTPGNYAYIMSGQSLLSKIKIFTTKYKSDYVTVVKGYQSAGTEQPLESLHKNEMPTDGRVNDRITDILTELITSRDSNPLILVDVTGLTDDRVNFKIHNEPRMNAIKRLADTSSREFRITHGSNGLDPYLDNDELLFTDRIGNTPSTETLIFDGSDRNSKVAENLLDANLEANDLTLKATDALGQAIYTNIFLADDGSNRQNLEGAHDYVLDAEYREYKDASDDPMEIQIRFHGGFGVPPTRSWSVPHCVKIGNELLWVAGIKSGTETSTGATLYVLDQVPNTRLGRGVHGTERESHPGNAECNIMYEASAYDDGSLPNGPFVDHRAASDPPGFPGLGGSYGGFYYWWNDTDDIIDGLKSYRRRRIFMNALNPNTFSGGDRVWIGSEVFDILTPSGNELLPLGTGVYFSERNLGRSAVGFPVYGHFHDALIRPLKLGVNIYTRDSPQAGSSVATEGLTAESVFANGVSLTHDLDILAAQVLIYKQNPVKRISVFPTDIVDISNNVSVGDDIELNGLTLAEDIPDQEFRVMRQKFTYDGSYGLELFANEPDTLATGMATDFNLGRDFTKNTLDQSYDILPEGGGGFGVSGGGGGTGLWQSAGGSDIEPAGAFNVLPNTSGTLGATGVEWTEVWSPLFQSDGSLGIVSGGGGDILLDSASGVVEPGDDLHLFGTPSTHWLNLYTRSVVNAGHSVTDDLQLISSFGHIEMTTGSGFDIRARADIVPYSIPYDLGNNTYGWANLYFDWGSFGIASAHGLNFKDSAGVNDHRIYLYEDAPTPTVRGLVIDAGTAASIYMGQDVLPWTVLSTLGVWTDPWPTVYMQESIHTPALRSAIGSPAQGELINEAGVPYWYDGSSWIDLSGGILWEAFSTGVRPITSGDDILPNGTADIGGSGSRWNKLWVNEIQDPLGAVTILGSGTNSVIIGDGSTSTAIFNDNIDMNIHTIFDTGTITPNGTNAYNLGSLANWWSTIFVEQIWDPGALTSLTLGSASGQTINLGNFLVTGTKAFRIDHPDDSEKWLHHSSVEGPERYLIYMGRATLVDGVKTITLPDYCDSLLKADSFEYSLTPIITDAEEGDPIVTGLYIKQEVADNQFVVGGADDIQFSWVLYGIRWDTHSQENPFQVEVPK